MNTDYRQEWQDGPFECVIQFWPTVFGDYHWMVVVPTGDGVGGWSPNIEDARAEIIETLNYLDSVPEDWVDWLPRRKADG